MKSQIDQILAVLERGEVVTAAEIAKRCGMTLNRVSGCLAFMREGSMLTGKWQHEKRRWVYSLRSRSRLIRWMEQVDNLNEYAANILKSTAAAV